MQREAEGRILSSIEAKKFGIMVSTKNGQHNMSLGKLIKQKIESKGSRRRSLSRTHSTSSR